MLVDVAKMMVVAVEKLVMADTEVSEEFGDYLKACRGLMVIILE